MQTQQSYTVSATEKETGGWNNIAHLDTGIVAQWIEPQINTCILPKSECQLESWPLCFTTSFWLMPSVR